MSHSEADGGRVYSTFLLLRSPLCHKGGTSPYGAVCQPELWTQDAKDLRAS